jgi:hypothetical protein
MGMDFNCYLAWIPSGQEPDWAAGKAAIDALAGTPPRDWPGSFVVYYDGELGAYDVDLETMSDAVGRGHAQRAAAHLRTDLVCVRDGLSGQRRDTALYDVPGLRLLISGGFSDGDPPSELAEAMSRLECAGVLEACGFNRDPQEATP